MKERPVKEIKKGTPPSVEFVCGDRLMKIENTKNTAKVINEMKIHPMVQVGNFENIFNISVFERGLKGDKYGKIYF